MTEMKRAMTGASDSGGGFSFVEVLIAVLVLGVILIPLFRMFSQGASGTVQNREEVLARSMAESIVNKLKSLDFKDSLIQTGPITDPSWIVGSEVQGAELMKRFIFRMEVSDPIKIPDLPFGFKTVILQVTWTSEGIPNTLKVPVLLSEGMNP
jgi:hypothetical protein